MSMEWVNNKQRVRRTYARFCSPIKTKRQVPVNVERTVSFIERLKLLFGKKKAVK